MNTEPTAQAPGSSEAGTGDAFVAYYEHQSTTPETYQRFRQTRDQMLRLVPEARRNGLRVADIGCGAGTSSQLWAEAGCVVRALDVNEGLIAIARNRSASFGSRIEYSVGFASQLPWPDASFDVVMLPELLEHVADWQVTLREATRVLDRGGLLYLSTTNYLCPIQHEFDLPLYSWYPAPLKKHCLALSLTTKPEWVNHAKYPALNWFSPYTLARELRSLGLAATDRFGMMARSSESKRKRWIARTISSVGPIHFLAHVLTPYTVMVGQKRAG
jgi:2-polyprenyl-6-hydroxyphenyl methylase/3-demethylubiquinone-9 3-methyltransferase